MCVRVHVYMCVYKPISQINNHCFTYLHTQLILSTACDIIKYPVCLIFTSVGYISSPLQALISFLVHPGYITNNLINTYLMQPTASPTMSLYIIR